MAFSASWEALALEHSSTKFLDSAPHDRRHRHSRHLGRLVKLSGEVLRRSTGSTKKNG
jgi:hypothetical protein